MRECQLGSICDGHQGDMPYITWHMMWEVHESPFSITGVLCGETISVTLRVSDRKYAVSAVCPIKESINFVMKWLVKLVALLLKCCISQEIHYSGSVVISMHFFYHWLHWELCGRWWKFRQNDDISVSVYAHSFGSLRLIVVTIKPLM